MTMLRENDGHVSVATPPFVPGDQYELLQDYGDRDLYTINGLVWLGVGDVLMAEGPADWVVAFVPWDTLEVQFVDRFHNRADALRHYCRRLQAFADGAREPAIVNCRRTTDE